LNGGLIGDKFAHCVTHVHNFTFLFNIYYIDIVLVPAYYCRPNEIKIVPQVPDHQTKMQLAQTSKQTICKAMII